MRLRTPTKSAKGSQWTVRIESAALVVDAWPSVNVELGVDGSEGVTGGVTGGEGGQVKKPLVAMVPLRQPRVMLAVKNWKPAMGSGSQLKKMPAGVVKKSVQV
jgi:hypothetical protein